MPFSLRFDPVIRAEPLTFVKGHCPLAEDARQALSMTAEPIFAPCAQRRHRRSSPTGLSPGAFDKVVIATTARTPVSWLGLRLAIGLRRLVTMRLPEDGGVDVKRWGLRFLIIEDTHEIWRTDLFSELRALGYRDVARNRLNVMMERECRSIISSCLRSGSCWR
jgi:hypothetical protein